MAQLKMVNRFGGLLTKNKILTFSLLIIILAGLSIGIGGNKVFAEKLPSEETNLQACVANVPYTFTKNLGIGDSGPAVLNLKCFLNSSGYLLGNYMNDYFGPMTKAALVKYQTAKGISPTNGEFGPSTRASINAYMGSIPSIKVTSPNGRESLTVGKSYKITWKSTGAASLRNVQIGIIDARFSTEAGERAEQTIAYSIPNTGSYTWIIPHNVNTMKLNSTKAAVYKIIVHSHLDAETGVAVGDSSDAPFSIIDLSPVVTSISPESGVVGTKVNIKGSGFKTLNDVGFVGSTNIVLGSSPDTASPINGEVNYRKIRSTDGKTLTINIPSGMSSQTGEDGLVHPGAAVIPGNYYIIVETSDGKSNPIYFKVTGNATSTPQPVLISPTVIPIGSPLIIKTDVTPGGAMSPVANYTASFEMNIANPLNTDVVLGLPGSSWPAFGTSSDYIKIYKNGVAETVNYNLLAIYTYPNGAILSTDGKNFKIPARGVVNMKVTYSFIAQNPAGNIYQVKLTGLGWGTNTLSNQMLPINMSTPLAFNKKPSQVASVMGALGDVFLDFWDKLGLFK